MITMSGKHITDSCFELADRLECRKRRLNLLVGAGLIISPVLLSIDALIFKMISYQKSTIADETVIVMAFIAVLCLILIAGSFKKYSELKKMKSSLDELESFEKTICREVLSKDADIGEAQKPESMRS